MLSGLGCGHEAQQITWRSIPDLDALDRIARCKILTCPEEIRLRIEGDEATVQVAIMLGAGSGGVLRDHILLADGHTWLPPSRDPVMKVLGSF